ncbi:GNAT family N-acetyltransferase [Devosia sp. Root413D1]|uniref:GNAT family N-acetyltransferase n=1 Tax=Devosia sp. Root413D1 TaxID=1736531 RepID=UPI000A60A7B0|nr:GNAT family N-acetyltransferase [Devosia sp. Root413D1]
MADGLVLHPLDNHLWNALNGAWAGYSRAVGRIRLLSPDIARVVALEAVSPANLSTLAWAMAVGEEILVIAPQVLQSTAELEVQSVKPVLQMVADGPSPAAPDIATVRLSVADFPQMLALVDVARPGPLGPRALELGNFRGIFDGAKLVALAGERLRFDRYTEVATVCTHPDYRGRGYARAVVSAVMQEIVDAGRTPFLGVDDGNIAAIRLYEALGFTHRSTFYLSLVKRTGEAGQADR